MAGKTYPELTSEADVQAADLLATYRSPGPLKRVPASALASYVASTLGGVNIFPNDSWQLLNGLGPGWNGQVASLPAHLAAFDTEQNATYTGNLPIVSVTNLAVAADATTGQNTVTATCVDPQFCYPGQLIIFAPGAHASLLVAAMRILTVNYTTKLITFKPPRNGAPTPGAVAFTFRPVMRADMAGVTGNGPDGWTKTATMLCWPDRFPSSTAGMTGTPGFTSNLPPANKRILVLRPDSNSDRHFYHTFADPVSLRGQTITFGFKVNRVSAGTATPFVGGSTYVEGTQVVSAAGWTWIEMQYLVPDNCTELQAGFVLKNSNAAAWRVVDAMAIVGKGIGASGYRPAPRGTLQRFLVKQTPDSFFGADFSFGTVGSASAGYGFEVDLYAGTTGAVAEDVPLIGAQLEGSPVAVTAPGRAIGIRTSYASPHRYSMIIFGTVSGYAAGDAGNFDLPSQGVIWMFSNAASAQWTDVSIDLNTAVLNLG